MLDINVNLADMFRGCVCGKDTDLEVFLETIESQTDSNLIVSELLLKLVNGTFRYAFLYVVIDKRISLYKSVGNLNTDIINCYQMISIPLSSSGNINFVLILLHDKKKVKLGTKQKRLIELLKRQLRKVDD